MQRVGISIPVQEELTADVLLRLGVATETSGFDTLSFGEIAGPEAFAMLGAVATRTSRIDLMTGIISSFTRSPALVAMGCATLDDLAPGRITLGLGASTKMIADDWHDNPFDKPLTRTIEFVEAFKAIIAGERVTYAGATLSVESFRLMPRRPHAVPVFIGAMNPKMLERTGAIADGVFLAFCPVDELGDRADRVRAGAAEAGRDPAAITIGVNVNAYAGPSPGAAVDRNRAFVLSYAALPTHRHNFVDTLGPALERLDAGNGAGAVAAVPDEAVHRICAIGDGDAVATRIRAYWDAGADLVTLHVLGLGRGDAESPFQTVEAVSAALGLSA